MVFEPTVSAGEQQQTYALYRAATGTGNVICAYINSIHFSVTWRDATNVTRYSTATVLCRLQLCTLSQSSDDKWSGHHNTERTIDIQTCLVARGQQFDAYPIIRYSETPKVRSIINSGDGFSDMPRELMPLKRRQYGIRLHHGVLLSNIYSATTSERNVCVGKASYGIIERKRFWNGAFWFPERFGSGCVPYVGKLVKTHAGRLVSFVCLMPTI